jgi:hypothetical protein
VPSGVYPCSIAALVNPPAAIAMTSCSPLSATGYGCTSSQPVGLPSPASPRKFWPQPSTVLAPGEVAATTWLLQPTIGALTSAQAMQTRVARSTRAFIASLNETT